MFPLTIHRISQIASATYKLLLVDLITSLLSAVHALPTNNSTTTAADTSPLNTTASAGNDRNSAFQVLADGTQDLAALVGIFATDSVERYAVDYNKGYLSATSATLSLLGLLGYVRALIKLGLGSDACHNAGFDTRSMRPLFGVPDHDRLPSDVLHAVHYVERIRSADYVTWKLAATRKHTVDTMPILDLAVPFYKSEPNTVTISSCRLSMTCEEYLNKHAFYRIPLIMALFIGLTCFIISPFRAGIVHHSWTMWYATLGLSITLLSSAIAWLWVYVQEQLPRGSADWVIRRADTLPNMNSSLEKKDFFAFTAEGYAYVTFDLKAVTGYQRGFICVFSIFCAFSAILGYICQYIEVRRISPSQSAKWLALQGLFAILRVAIWIWDPKFDDFVMDRSRPNGTRNCVHLSEAQIVMLWYTHIYPTRIRPEKDTLRRTAQTKAEMDPYKRARREEARPPNWIYWPVPLDLQIPTWALSALDHSRWDISALFELARRLHTGGPTWQDDLDIFTGATHHWDMPGWVFMLWVDAHTSQDLISRQDRWNAYSCRIIKTKDGKYHFLPYWTTSQIYRFIPGHDVDMGGKNGTRYVGNQEIPIKVFGNPAEDESFLAEFWDYGKMEEEGAVGGVRKQELILGWEKVVREGFSGDLGGVRKHIVESTEGM